MNCLNKYILKVLRKLYTKTVGSKQLKPVCEQEPNIVSKLIYDKLSDDKSCMIARFGAFELSTLVNYLGIIKGKPNYIKYLKGEVNDWWWNKSLLNYMHINAGFYPPTNEKIEEFCKLMIQDIPCVDILGSWIAEENLLTEYLRAKNVHIRLIEPFWTENPWTIALKGKKILVVHPFVETIRSQYNKRELLFINPNILPEFGTLNLIKAVQSLGKQNDRFVDWFEALDYMKTEIDKVDYDICLIGAGAYGFHLAAHIKDKEKKQYILVVHYNYYLVLEVNVGKTLITV